MLSHRKLFSSALILILLAWSGALSRLSAADLIDLRIHHIPPDTIQAGQPLTVSADIIDSQQVAMAIINWRAIGEPGFRRNKMVLSDPSRHRFTATIPAAWLTRPGIEYFISTVDINQEFHSLFKDEKFPQQVWFEGEKPRAPEATQAVREEFALFAAEEVITAAAKHEQKLIEAPSAVSVISREEIRSMGLTSLADILRIVPGIEVYEISPGYPVVGFRGQANETNDLVVVLLDGREVNNPALGTTFYAALPVSPLEIERIEIIRGPGSSLYGANAFSGVINIITQSEKSTDRIVSGYGGVGNGGHPILGTFLRAGGFIRDQNHYYVSGGYKQEAFWSTRLGNAQNIGYGRVQFQRRFDQDDKIALSLEGGVDSGDWDYFFPLSAVGMSGQEYFARLGFRGYGLSTQLYWNRLTGNMRFIDPEIDTLALHSTTPLNTDVLDLSVQYDYDFGRWSRLIAGGNFRINQFQSYKFDPTKKQENNYGGFIQDEIRPWSPLIFTLGVRYDGSDTIKERTPSPRVSATYILKQDQALRASFGQAFRKPSFLQYGMRINGLRNTVPISEPVVRDYTQKVQAYELGYSGKFLNRLKTGLDLYYNRYSDLIAFDLDQNAFSNWKQNSKTYAIGGELSLEVGINRYLSSIANYSFNQIYSDYSNPGLGIVKGTQMKEAPIHKGNLALNFKWRSLSSRLSFHYYGERTIPDFRTLDIPSTMVNLRNPVQVPAFSLINLRLAYSLWRDRLELGLTMQDLQDLFTGKSQYQYQSIYYWIASSNTHDFGGEMIRGLIYGTLELKF
jgi:iron complex outermembrane receptor protein